MELVVFDLDGTLLDGEGDVSDFTRDTLVALSGRGVAYTVATGRTLHAARELLRPHGFSLPQIYKNGVMIWDPRNDDYAHQNFLNPGEVRHVIEAMLAASLTPFIFTLEPGNHHAIYHPPTQDPTQARLAGMFADHAGVSVLPAALLPADAEITNISAMGSPNTVGRIEALVSAEPDLVAYAGEAWEGDNLRWIDIHHTDASKGGAIELLRRQLGVERVVCFGDSDNDLSMFAGADEAYAPANATDEVKAAATAVIGRHDEEGVARFLRERFLD